MGLWSNIKTALTRPRVIHSGGVVTRDLAVWDQAQRIGGGLSPADVSAIIQQADTGDIARLVELANESRQKDGHIHMALRARETWLSPLPFVVEPYALEGQDPTPQDVEIASFVRETIESATGDGEDFCGFDDLVENLQGAIYHGHSTSEQAWAKDGSRLIITGWGHIDQRRFGFRQKDSRLVLADNLRVSGLRSFGVSGIDLRRDYPAQFVTHQPREMGDIPLREGLARLIIWCALFRNWSIGDWMKLAEMAWKPWRIGKFTKDAGKADRVQLRQMLEHLTSSGVATFNSDKLDLDIKWPEGMASGGKGQSAHHELCAFMGSEVSKAVRGTTLTSEAGDRGARSLGEVHSAGERVLRDRDGKRIAGTLQRDTIRPLVQWNFGPNANLPKAYFATDEALDLKAFADGVEKLCKAGLPIGVDHVYDMIGFPKPGEGDELLGDAIDVDLTDLDEDDKDGDKQEPTAPTDGEDEPGEEAEE